MRWFWSRKVRSAREAVVEGQRRFEEVEKDDERIAQIQKRVQKIVRENSLAPAIMKALGVPR